MTPDSPEVKSLVAKAVAFLESHPGEGAGYKVLVAYALLKAGPDYGITPSHPAVVAALQTVKSEGDRIGANYIYDLGVAILFMIALDEADQAADYRADINGLKDKLLAVQKEHGGWGYKVQSTGDTSQTQYGVLALWELERVGHTVPDQAWEGVCNWLLRTQAPDGYWGYQGKDPGSFSLTPQVPVNKHSLAAGGLGSVYICLDVMGGKAALGPQEKKPSDAPDGLEAVEDKPDKPRLSRLPGVDRGILSAALSRGDGWFAANYTLEPVEYRHYYLYGYERYQTFKEKAETGNVGAQARWYDEGVALLAASQATDGSWYSQTSAPGDTAFSILFLVRSTAKSVGAQLAALGGGWQIGGRGLPTDATDVRLRDGNLVPKPMTGPADALLAALEDPTNPDQAAALEGLYELVLEADDATLSRNAARLRKLAASGTPEAKVVAIKALAKTRNLDDVPLLLHLMADEDWLVADEAYRALRFISRRFASLPPHLASSDLQRRATIEDFEGWLLSIRPDAVLDD